MTALLHRVAVGRRFGERATMGDAFFVAGSVGIERLPFTITNGVEKGFSGVNSYILLQVMKDQSWSDPRFFTANQVKQAGWTVKPDAKEIGLQFLVSTDEKGLPLESPTTLIFNVFNASDISGPFQATAIEKPRRVDVEKTVTMAGFGVNQGLADGLRQWLDEVQSHELESTDCASVELRTRLAMSLLEIQFGVPMISSLPAALSDDCLSSIRENPLSFSHAANDSRKLESFVMHQIKLAQVEREASQSLALKGVQGGLAGSSASLVGGEMPKSYLLELESLFANRAAVLHVPFAEKDEAKALGAMWFSPESVWFVPDGSDVSVFAKWEPSAVRLSVDASREAVIEAFCEVMAGLGLDASGDIKDDGKWHNVAVERSGQFTGNKSGSYIFSMDGGRLGQPIGTVLNKYTGESFTWTTHKSGSLTPQQRVQCKVDVEAREAAAALTLERIQNQAAIHAAEIWAAGGSAAGHGYVLKKGISESGLRQIDGAALLKYTEFKGESGGSCIYENEKYLLVPMMTSTGELRAVQVINGDGAVKLFMRGAQKKGTMLVMGAPSFTEVAKSDTPFVSYLEGVATGASFHAATKLPVVVCFDAGNLETVFSETVGQLADGIVPVLAVDNDQFHVEKGLGYLSEKVGLNPHVRGDSVDVRSGPFEVRPVALGEAVADGVWHQAAKGSYCISFNREEGEDYVRSMSVDILPEVGRKSSATFLNRGIDAGLACLNMSVAKNLVTQVVIVAPVFKSLLGRPTDWNDLAQREGLDAVRAVLKQQDVQVVPHAPEVSVKNKVLSSVIAR